jgi:hypothetical protein
MLISIHQNVNVALGCRVCTVSKLRGIRRKKYHMLDFRVMVDVAGKMILNV